MMLTKTELAKEFHSSEKVVQRYIKELKKLIPERYPYLSVVHSGRTVMVNKGVYMDFLAHRNVENPPSFDIDEVERFL